MTKWTKVEKTSSSAGRQPRNTFAVSRSKKNPDTSIKLICPTAQINGDKADVFISDDGKMVRFQIGAEGTFAVQKGKGTGHTRSITIPREMAPLLPIGLTEAKIEVDADEGFLTLDTAQFADVVAKQNAEAPAAPADAPAEAPADAPADAPKTAQKGKKGKAKADDSDDLL